MPRKKKKYNARFPPVCSVGTSSSVGDTGLRTLVKRGMRIAEGRAQNQIVLSYSSCAVQWIKTDRRQTQHCSISATVSTVG